MDFSFINNVLPADGDPHAMDKNLKLGLLGLSLMQQGQPTNDPNQSFGMGLLNAGFNLPSGANPAQISQAAATQGQNYLANNVQPESPVNATQGLPQSLPSNQGDYLHMLQQQAALAHPGNPMMQQVAITQAIQESGLHPSQLATQNNNLFGIKAPGTSGNVNMMTTEYVNGQPTSQNASFGKNANVADSFIQHRNLLEHNKRYHNVVNAQNPNAAFNALQQAGYATDPHYAQQLSNVYKQYVAPLYN